MITDPNGNQASFHTWRLFDTTATATAWCQYCSCFFSVYESDKKWHSSKIQNNKIHIDSNHRPTLSKWYNTCFDIHYRLSLLLLPLYFMISLWNWIVFQVLLYAGLCDWDLNLNCAEKMRVVGVTRSHSGKKIIVSGSLFIRCLLLGPIHKMKKKRMYPCFIFSRSSFFLLLCDNNVCPIYLGLRM